MAEENSNGGEVALETRDVAGARMFSPSAARNRDAIREVFVEHMPSRGAILEIGSGTGEHAVHLASALPDVRWMPGDPDPESRASIAGWTARAGLSNMAPPHAIDVSSEHWPLKDEQSIAAVVSINMIHIAPFKAAQGLFAGAGKLLKNGGKLFLYGPFSRNGAHISASNAEFDTNLRHRNRAWGVRDLEGDIVPIARNAGLALETVIAMPANNFSVILTKQQPAPEVR